MKRGDIWWLDFEPAQGSEIRKTRPAIILSNDAANRNLPRVVVVPLTSNTARIYPGESIVSVAGKPAKAMADQIMAADKQRLRSQIGHLSPTDLRHVEQCVMLHLGLSQPLKEVP